MGCGCSSASAAAQSPAPSLRSSALSGAGVSPPSTFPATRGASAPAAASPAPPAAASPAPPAARDAGAAAAAAVADSAAFDWWPGDDIVRPPDSLSTVALQLGAVAVRYGAASIAGCSATREPKTNQDSYAAQLLPQLDGGGDGAGGAAAALLLGVFDGHGPRGEDAAAWASTRLPLAALAGAAAGAPPVEALLAAFPATHERFCAADVACGLPAADARISGTTAVVALLTAGGLLAVANAGDSRAMLASESPTAAAAAADGGVPALLARPLSRDHKPDVPAERARTLAAGARILSELELGIAAGSASKYYVCRVDGEGAIKYGVLFTRSLGDADGHEHLGLSAEPELAQGPLEREDRFLVVASDGVWDMLDERDVAGIVAAAAPDGRDAGAAAAAVCEAARDGWDATAPRRDDITAIVCFLELAGAAGGSAGGASGASGAAAVSEPPALAAATAPAPASAAAAATAAIAP